MPRRTAQDTLAALADLDIDCVFVQQPGEPPALLVLAEVAGVGAHGRLDGDAVANEVFVLNVIGQKFIGLVASDHGPSLA